MFYCFRLVSMAGNGGKNEALCLTCLNAKIGYKFWEAVLQFLIWHIRCILNNDET